MIGKTLSNYQISSKLGEGGMGEVYRASDTKLGREVAVKVLPEVVAGDPERLARFEREAKLLAALEHPSIAAIYGLEEVDGQQLLIMQLAEGETLKERIDRGAIPLEQALPIALQIAEESGVSSSWREDSREIIYGDWEGKLMSVEVDTSGEILDVGESQVLLRIEAPSSLTSWFSTTSDTERILVFRGQARQADNWLNLVVNWPQELEQR